MVVDVGCAQGEEWRSAASEEQLSNHEDEDWQGGRLVGRLDAIVLPVVLVVVRGQRRGRQAWKSGIVTIV